MNEFEKTFDYISRSLLDQKHFVLRKITELFHKTLLTAIAVLFCNILSFSSLAQGSEATPLMEIREEGGVADQSYTQDSSFSDNGGLLPETGTDKKTAEREEESSSVSTLSFNFIHYVILKLKINEFIK